MTICRDTAHATGNIPYCGPKNDRYFGSNLLTNELRFVDLFLENRAFCLKKMQGKFIGSVDDIARRKLSLKYWSGKLIG